MTDPETPLGPHQRAYMEQRRRDRERLERYRREGLDVYGNPLPTGKRCTHCRRDLDFAAFPPNRKISTGLSSWCRDCHNEANREWRKRRREAAQA